MMPLDAKTFIVHAHSADYATFPSLQQSLQQDETGRLYITFRHAPNDLAPGTYSHIDVRSTALLKCSMDTGQSWTQIGDSIRGHLTQAGIQDPSLTILSDGTFLLTYFHWRQEPDHPQARQGAVMEGVWVRRSIDRGQSWDIPVHVPVDDRTQLAISEPAIELTDGTLLLVGYASHRQGGGQAAFLSRSGDRGRSWTEPTIIAHDPSGMVDYQEPALLDLGEGHLLCMMRSVDRHLTADEPDETARQRGMTAYMYQSHSWDNGQSWRPTTRTAMFGHPPNLIRLRDGRVLCSYGHRRTPFGVRACLSTDAGMNWDVEKEVVLRTDGGGGDIGYPSSVEMADGSVLTSYYFHTAADPIRRIEATRWHPGA